MKKVIINADDFAYDIFHNDAVLDGFKKGILNSVSIMSNTENYLDAVNQILPLCPGLQVGIHLNITEGKALIKDNKNLVDKEGNFKNSFFSILMKSGNKHFLKEVESEFRAQIEKAKKDINLLHIDSHMHIHGIPPLFETVCKLAMEYNIPFIRTQKEIPYKIRGEFDLKKYFVNMFKIFILNYFTIINKQFLTKYPLKTNDYIIGVGYTGMMNKETVLEGLRNIRKDNSITQILIHPSKDFQNPARYKEFEIFNEDDLKERIENLEFEFYKYNEEENIC